MHHTIDTCTCVHTYIHAHRHTYIIERNALLYPAETLKECDVTTRIVSPVTHPSLPPLPLGIQSGPPQCAINNCTPALLLVPWSHSSTTEAVTAAASVASIHAISVCYSRLIGKHLLADL